MYPFTHMVRADMPTAFCSICAYLRSSASNCFF
jgi:hypothetical protein